MRFQAPRGTFDVLPDQQPYWRHLIGRLHHLAALYGFQQIDVPVFEEVELFARSIGEATDIVEKEMYIVGGKEGDSFALRPEFTAGTVRAYIEHGMHVWPQPVRLYSIGPAFRRERPQKGRYRQFHQFNAEIIGEQDPLADLEVMSLAWDLYEDLGFKGLSFQLNSTGDPKCKPVYVKALVAYYQDHLGEVCDDCRRRIQVNPLRVLDCKRDQCQPVIAQAPRITDYLCDECAEHFAALRQMLDDLGRPYTLNHRLVRGLDYYTRTVFEVWAEEGLGAQNAVCGGGRYDGLAELLGGPPTPGVGFAAGLERIILTMQDQGIAVPPLPSPAVFVAHAGADGRRASVGLLTELRRAGIPAVSAYGDRSLKAQMRQASRAAVTYTLILGDEELASDSVTVRDMNTGTQERVPRRELVQRLKSSLK